MLRRSDRRRLLAIAVAAAPFPSLRAQSAPPPASLDRYLRGTIGLDDIQLADVRGGKVVTRMLKSELDRDVTVFGIVAVHASRATYDARLQDTTVLAATQPRIYGILHDPVTAADVRDIVVDENEYKDLKSCKVNDCPFKLPVERMADFAEHVDWKSRDAKRQVDSIVRADAESFVNAYRASGSAAMVSYDDAGSVRSGDVFAHLLAESSYFPDLPASIRGYLMMYPSSRPDGARDVVYWSKDQIPRLRPTITFTHMVVSTPEGGPSVVARKQIYADHYFEGAFEVLSVFDAPAAEVGAGPVIYLVDVRRYRFDHLPSGGIFNIRGRVRNHLEDVLRADLERERTTVESRGK